MTGFAIVSTTIGSEAEAQSMARALVEARLAGCVQVMPVASVYRWQGVIEEAREHLLLCKIVAADFAAVEAAIRERHTYDVPEIVLTAIKAGHAPYLKWLAEACTAIVDPNSAKAAVIPGRRSRARNR